MRCAILLLLAALTASSQPYEFLLKRGHVIDPANGRDAVMDVAVSAGRIARVAPEIAADQARTVIDAAGLYVTPGLIDLHAHVFGYAGALFPDDAALPAGTTTVVDAGGAGWRTFDTFKAHIIDRAKTRVLALLHIAGRGMVGPAAEDNLEDMDPEKTAAKIKEHPQLIVGVKVAHYGKPGWDALKRAIAAGKLAGVPVMVDDKIFTNTGRHSREKLLDVMRPGDLHTHMYNDRQVEIVSRFDGKLQSWALEARRRGVLFDLGHGGGSFLWTVAAPATRQGFWPDTISTDLHASSILGPESDMPNCISKMLALGMRLPEAILRSTLNPAKAIRRFPELGTLSEGAVADIAVLRLENGVFALKDSWGKKLLATERVRNVLTIRAGALVWDQEGLAFAEWSGADASGAKP